MQQFKSANKFLIAIFMCVVVLSGFAANAVKVNVPKTSQDLPEWIKFSLEPESILKEIYSASIAQSVFVKLNHKGFLPPIQYLPRPNADLDTESENLSKEILENLEVDVKKAKAYRPRPFKAGKKQELYGKVMEFDSMDGKSTVVTCMAFVKDEKGNVHAAWIQAARSLLPKCSQNLVDLARSGYLTK